MSNLTLSGRVAAAGVVATFAMAGLTAALDNLFFSRHGLGLADLVVLLGAPLFGALVAKAILTESRYLHVGFVAFAALIGVVAGMATRSWLSIFWAPISWFDPPAWYPAAPNAVWVASWTFAAAWCGTFWERSSREGAGDVRFALIFLALLILLVIVLVWPS